VRCTKQALVLHTTNVTMRLSLLDGVGA